MWGKLSKQGLIEVDGFSEPLTQKGRYWQVSRKTVSGDETAEQLICPRYCTVTRKQHRKVYLAQLL